MSHSRGGETEAQNNEGNFQKWQAVSLGLEVTGGLSSPHRVMSLVMTATGHSVFKTAAHISLPLSFQILRMPKGLPQKLNIHYHPPQLRLHFFFFFKKKRIEVWITMISSVRAWADRSALPKVWRWLSEWGQSCGRKEPMGLSSSAGLSGVLCTVFDLPTSTFAHKGGSGMHWNLPQRVQIVCWMWAANQKALFWAGDTEHPKPWLLARLTCWMTMQLVFSEFYSC